MQANDTHSLVLLDRLPERGNALFWHAGIVTPDQFERNRLNVEIVYVVKRTNDRRNLVFPFYTIPDDGSDY